MYRVAWKTWSKTPGQGGDSLDFSVAMKLVCHLPSADHQRFFLKSVSDSPWYQRSQLQSCFSDQDLKFLLDLFAASGLASESIRMLQILNRHVMFMHKGFCRLRRYPDGCCHDGAIHGLNVSVCRCLADNAIKSYRTSILWPLQEGANPRGSLQWRRRPRDKRCRSLSRCQLISTPC